MSRLQDDLAQGSDEYLDAVIREVLRLRPVVPVLARKVREEVALNGHVIPAGTVLMVSIYLLHRDPALHSDPTEFRPERFLDDESEPWLPFGGGVRRCRVKLRPARDEVVIRAVLAAATLRALDPADEPVARRRFTFAPANEARATVEGISNLQ